MAIALLRQNKDKRVLVFSETSVLFTTGHHIFPFNFYYSREIPTHKNLFRYGTVEEVKSNIFDTQLTAWQDSTAS